MARPTRRLWEGDFPVVGQFLNARPVLGRGCAERREHQSELVDVVVAGEERASCDELAQDAAHRPHVHGATVELGAVQQFGGAVPACCHLPWKTKSNQCFSFFSL